MDSLALIYNRLLLNPNDELNGVELYRSEIHYVRQALVAKFSHCDAKTKKAIEDNGKGSFDDRGVYSVSLKEVYEYLEEEGMLPSSKEVEE